MMKKMMMV
ncbi:hypothetical protein LINPERHAP1_LOCUS27106 [Linum perenne]